MDEKQTVMIPKKMKIVYKDSLEIRHCRRGLRGDAKSLPDTVLVQEAIAQATK